jgi:hypothetical protein
MGRRIHRVRIIEGMNMSKSQEKRKNFPTKIVDEVFEEQGRCCDKCGKPLLIGFHAHHKNGDNSDNRKENCSLQCSSCHGGELYKTLQDQKKAVILDLDSLIKTGVEGKASGATIEKLLDTIKLKLSLQRQVMDDPPLEPPASVKVETYITVLEHGLKEYEKGIKEGIIKGIDLISEIKNVKSK